MENVKVVELLIKLTEHPAQLLIVLSVLLSYYLLKQNKELLKQTIESFTLFNKNLQEDINAVRAEFNRLASDLSSSRSSLDSSVQSLREELSKLDSKISMLNSRVNDDMGLYKNVLSSLESVGEKTEENYGKIILITDELGKVKKTVDDNHKWTIKSFYRTLKKVQDK